MPKINGPARRRAAALCATLFVCALLSAPPRLLAQEGNDYRAERARALQLLEQNKVTEALPLLEKLTAANPNDEQVMFFFGFALLANTKTITDGGARRQARVRARGALLRARELGFQHPLLTSLLESLPPDGGGEATFSENQAADAAMREGEAAFVKGDLDTALAAYQRALAADPKLYEAALFAGDMYFKKNQFDKAAEWYARAVSINPDRETAYRYAASPLMEQKRLEEARAKYVEAVIAEPYNRLTWAGLQQWAEAARVTLAHPRVEIPTSVTTPKDNKMAINLDPKMLDDKKDEAGTGAWMMYGLTRASWATSEFAKAYPNEKTYRHSLREEAAALGGVVTLVKERQQQKKIKQLDPSLANLVKLSDAGLLEAFILLALPDEGIAQDYAEYRKANRDKLRRYLLEYVTAGKQ